MTAPRSAPSTDMRDLLFVAHAVAFAALASGLRAWLHRNRAPAAAAPPGDGARYRALIDALAELERQKEAQQISAADYETRRDGLMRDAARLRGG